MEQGKLSSGVKIGIGTALIAWSCCISAVVLGFLGLGTAAAFFAAIQDRYHWWLVALAFLFFDGAIYYVLKHYHGTCNFRVIQRNWSLVTFIILLALFGYFILQALLPSLMTLSQT
ncbi:MAG: hypothetical protein WEA04_01390 [Candidatus Andersenbacteria bacterium]